MQRNKIYFLLFFYDLRISTSVFFFFIYSLNCAWVSKIGLFIFSFGQNELDFSYKQKRKEEQKLSHQNNQSVYFIRDPFVLYQRFPLRLRITFERMVQHGCSFLSFHVNSIPLVFAPVFFLVSLPCKLLKVELLLTCFCFSCFLNFISLVSASS